MSASAAITNTKLITVLHEMPKRVMKWKHQRQHPDQRAVAVTLVQKNLKAKCHHDLWNVDATIQQCDKEHR